MIRGTRQGDSTGGDNFNETYSMALDRYSADRFDPHMVIKHEGRRVDLSKATFVDDILEMTIGDQIPELDKRLKDNTANLIEHLANIGSELEPTKEVVLVRCAGPGATKKMAQATETGVLTDGQKPSVARYLGGGLTLMASMKPISSKELLP